MRTLLWMKASAKRIHVQSNQRVNVCVGARDAYFALARGAGVLLPPLAVRSFPAFLVSAVCLTQTGFKSFNLKERTVCVGVSQKHNSTTVSLP